MVKKLLPLLCILGVVTLSACTVDLFGFFGSDEAKQVMGYRVVRHEYANRSFRFGDAAVEDMVVTTDIREQLFCQSKLPGV